MRRWLWLLLLAGPAFAGNGISSISVVKYRNLTSVALEARVSGDDDSSAVLQIFQRIRGSGNSFDSGMVMVRRLGFRYHEGRILRMSAGQTVEFFIQGRDAGGGFNTPLDTVSCAQVSPPVATGVVVYADAVNGSNANSGLTQALAKKTITAAWATLKAAADSGGNGGIRVLPGEYHETVTLDCCTDGRPRFLEGLGGRDTIIVCGANEEVETGNYSVGNALSWALRPAEVGKADSIYATKFTPGDSTQLVVLGFGEMLHRKTSLLALGRDSTDIGLGFNLNHGEVSGWWWQSAGGGADTLYVKRRSGASPAGLTLHTGYRDELVSVRAPNWRVANISIRYAGGLTSQNGTNSALWTNRASPGMNGYGIVLGRNISAPRFAVDSLKVYGCNAEAVYNPVFNVPSNADSGTITNCYIDGLTVGRMAYGAAKSRAEEEANQILIRCQGTSVRGNFVTGTFNGIQGGNGVTDSLSGRFTEISGNFIKGCTDDAVEVDDAHDINMLVMGNTMLDTGSGISLTPAYSGPVFFFYNTVAQFRAKGMKLGSGQTAITKVYNNTFASTSGGDNVNGFGGCQAIDATPGSTTDNMEFCNNIFVAKRGLGVNNVIVGFSTTTNSFNYNLMDSLQSTRLWVVGATSYSFPSLQTTFGWEANGSRAAVPFADSVGGRWSLVSNRAVYGKRITGVNTDLNGRVIGGNKKPVVGSQPCHGKPCEFDD